MKRSDAFTTKRELTSQELRTRDDVMNQTNRTSKKSIARKVLLLGATLALALGLTSPAMGQAQPATMPSAFVSDEDLQDILGPPTQ